MHIAPSHLSRALKSIFAAVFAFFALIAVSTPMTHAAPGVRANVTYQARLMDASGYPVADGVYQVEFSLDDAPVAGNRLWTADGTVGAPLPVNVTVQDGLFTVLLGDGVTQLPFGDIDWNSDSLYLGVTIGADGEMSPRRPITAVPQAINSAQLGGMSASSSDTYGGESQFTILQASTTAATSTRSALDVRSNGTSVANDFIFRAISSTGLPLFTINSQGTVSTTDLLVDGIAVCRADGTDCLPVASGTSTLQEVYDEGNAITLGNNAFELTAIASGTNLLPFFGVEGYASFVAKGFGEGGLALVHASSSVGPTTTYMYFTSDVNDPINGTSSYIASQMQTGILRIAANSELGLTAENQGNISLQTVGGNIILNSATTTLQSNVIFSDEVASDFNPFLDDTYSLGTPLLRWNGQFNLVTSTYVHIAAAPGAVPPYDGAMLINSASQGDASGLDFVSIADGSNDGMLLLYREDRTTNDGYAEILMNQASADGFHRMLFEVKEGIEENDIEMTPTSTWSGGDIIPKNDNTFSLGLSNYRWNGEFSNATSANLIVTSSLTVGGQSVCLQNGVNCPVAGSATLQTAYDGTGIGEGRIIDVEGGAITLQGFASGTNVLSGFPGHEAYNHFEILHASNSQEGIAFGSWRAAGFATGTYMSFASNMSDLTDGGTAFRWDQSGTFVIEQTTTTGGISLIMNDLGFDFNGTTTYSDQSFFNDTVNVAGSILVGGVNVCLQNGTNCPAGGGDLQDAYDAGRFITLDDGRIDLTAAFGTPDDFTFSVRGSPIDHTKVFGAGSAYDANIGFDISMTQDGNTTGTLFTFTNNRANPESSLSSAYLSHEVFDTGSGLTLGNATVTFGLSEDSINGGNEFGQFGFYRYFQIEADPLGGDPALNIINNGAGATSMIRFDNTLVQNDLHLIDDQDPNGVVTPVASGDLLVRNQSTGGPNTNLYINTDGTDSGWVGVVTEDSLNSHSLQEAYDIGSSIDTGFGPFTLFTSTTAPDLFPAFPWVDAYRTLVSEGFTNDGIGFTHGSGTWDNQHFIEFFANESLPPGSTSSSYIMGDTVSGTLNLVSTNDLFLEAVLDEIVLTSATTTFNSNIVLSGSNYVGSDLVPFTTDLYDLGSSSRRWNEVYAQGVSSTILSLVTGTLGHDYTTGPISARSVLETSHTPGGIEGFDIANFTFGGTVTGTALFTTANRNAGAPFGAGGLSGVTSTGFYGYHSPSEGSDLFIFSQANDKSTFIRMTDDEIAIRAGQGTSSTGGIIDMQGVSSTAAGVFFRNGTSSATNQNWDMYARHAAFGERYPGNTYATGTDVYGMYIGFAGSSGVLCLDDVTSPETCPTIPTASIVSEGAINAFDFDLAEMYESPDQLEPGDIIVASTVDDMQVVRSSNTSTLPMGIVSTKPGLLLGRTKSGAHPIALAGRVPTKVSTINGEIKTGDLLAPTSIPGVAGKAVEDGPIVGIALQSYNGADVGKIEVFVKTSWYSKPNSIDQVVENNTYITNVVASEPDVVRRGLAKIETGAVKVHISFETLNGYPFVQTTPRGLIVGAWSTDNYSDTGFDIILEQPQTFDVVFGWEARALDGSTMMIMSDGTSLLVDPTSGQVVVQEPEPIEEEPSTPSEPPAPTPVGETEPDPVPEPAPEPEPTPEPAPEPAPSPEPSNP